MVCAHVDLYTPMSMRGAHEAELLGGAQLLEYPRHSPIYSRIPLPSCSLDIAQDKGPPTFFWPRSPIGVLQHLHLLPKFQVLS